MADEQVKIRDLRGRKRFAQVYEDEIHAARHWPSADFRVYVTLLVFCDGGNGWAVSWARIALVTGLHRDTVRESIRRLKRDGVIAVRSRFLKGLQQSNEIQIFGPKLSPGVEDQTPPRVEDQTPPRVEDQTPQTRPETLRTRSVRTSPPTPPRGAKSSALLSWVVESMRIQAQEYGWTDEQHSRLRDSAEFRATIARGLFRWLKSAKRSRPDDVIGIPCSYRRIEAALLVVATDNPPNLDPEG